MSSKRVGRGALGRDVLRACVRPCVRFKKGPKGLQNDQETCIAVVKRAKVNSYNSLTRSMYTNMELESEFGTTFGKVFFKNRKNLEGFFAAEECKNASFFHFAELLSRNVTFLL